MLWKETWSQGQLVVLFINCLWRARHSGESPRFPFKLFLQLLDVLLADSLLSSAPAGLASAADSCLPKVTPFPQRVTASDHSRWIQKGCAISAQRKTALMGHYDARAPCGVSQGTWATWQLDFSLWWILLSSPDFVPSIFLKKKSDMLNSASESTSRRIQPVTVMGKNGCHVNFLSFAFPMPNKKSSGLAH